MSPDFTLAAGHGYALNFRSSFAYNSASSSDDYLRVRIVAEDASSAVLFTQRGAPVEVDARWVNHTLAIPASFAGKKAHVVIEAADLGKESLVEAAVDDVAVMRVS